MTSAARRLAAIALIAATARRAGAAGADLVAALAREQAAAAADPQLAVIVSGLWRSEALSVSASRRGGGREPLLHPNMPASAQPIAHVGWATGITQRFGFEPRALLDTLTTTTDERFRDFCFDGVGADLLVYERPVVRILSRAVGLIEGAVRPPDPRGRFAAFRQGLPAAADRVVAHGYGRMIYVTRRNLRAALREVPLLPPEWAQPAVQGIAFAFAMVNNHDLPHILERSRNVPDPLARPFQDGLVYALIFSEWFAPGLLARWQGHGSFEAELVGRAGRESALNTARGYPLAFALSSRSH